MLNVFWIGGDSLNLNLKLNAKATTKDIEELSEYIGKWMGKHKDVVTGRHLYWGRSARISPRCGHKPSIPVPSWGKCDLKILLSHQEHATSTTTQMAQPYRACDSCFKGDYLKDVQSRGME